MDIRVIKFFEVENSMSEIFSSLMGSMIDAAIRKAKTDTSNFIIGAAIMKNKSIIEHSPKAFFIITQLASTKSNPSDKYPPNMGT